MEGFAMNRALVTVLSALYAFAVLAADDNVPTVRHAQVSVRRRSPRPTLLQVSEESQCAGRKSELLVPAEATETIGLMNFLDLNIPGTNENWSLTITNQASGFFNIQCGYDSDTHKLCSVQVRKKIKAGTSYEEIENIGSNYCSMVSKSLGLPPFVDSGRGGRIFSGARDQEYSYRSKRLNNRYVLLMEADSDFMPESTNDITFAVLIQDCAIMREGRMLKDKYRDIKDLTFCGYKFGEKFAGELHGQHGGHMVRLDKPYHGFTNAYLCLDQSTTNIYEISLWL